MGGGSRKLKVRLEDSANTDVVILGVRTGKAIYIYILYTQVYIYIYIYTESDFYRVSSLGTWILRGRGMALASRAAGQPFYHPGHLSRFLHFLRSNMKLDKGSLVD